MAQIIDGKALAARLQHDLTIKARDLKVKLGREVCLAVILVGNDPASHIYVSKKAEKAAEIGIRSIKHILPETTSQEELNTLINQLNQDESVDGILLQLPLPKHLNRLESISKIDPRKDVDGLHPTNQGLLFQGLPTLAPCTPQGCIQLIKSCRDDLTGNHVIVVGTSVLVGRPLLPLLIAEGATVTLANSKTQNLAKLTSQADILISATGRASLITADHVKNGAIVIDVGITRHNGKLTGDVDFDTVKSKASFITPVPGGVGPMTIINLMANVIRAASN
ncbi:MAG: bifunctional 5,10-methylene-tetrahydrofolate dehydrogenase/5,10-methylene-tetrahydrofolate cyclohydrolase [Candidatus Paracaedibacteraceae bacterium]|nr:bifunctional 5,10-methylene-tetrahydrofolate dehydrogenase/5,10-methylene-tetrahydrofolate cyclohydrolase [Candidatus Paracaedibacteraceae bacterium]